MKDAWELIDRLVGIIAFVAAIWAFCHGDTLTAIFFMLLAIYQRPEHKRDV
jgi:hypothetical protein